MKTATQDLAKALRPRSLDELIGNDNIKPAIRNFIQQECCQWLFYGPTGTGKTSLAYIVARELRGFDQDGDSEILDLNAADFRTAAEVRELLNATQTYPMNGKYRVIILDEVQTLTKEAKTMLLKPLEQEVSANAWILCTMDIKSLDDALRHRCKEFALQPMGERERAQLVSSAAAHLNYSGDTSRFLRLIDKKHVESARDILRCFEKFSYGMSAEDAVGE